MKACIDAGYTRPTAPNELAELRGNVNAIKTELLEAKAKSSYGHLDKAITRIDAALAEIDKMRGKGA